MRRISPELLPDERGSPSQRIAVLFPRPCSICRSRQLWLRFVFPPTNHFAYGAFHSSTLSHFLNQCSSLATSPQNFSGFSIDSRYSLSYSARLLICACAANSGRGGNKRFSCSADSIPDGC